jgi:hypothetical protein
MLENLFAPALLASSLFAAGQSLSMSVAPAPQMSPPSEVKQATGVKRDTDELRQQVDVDAAALSKIPADPLVHLIPWRRSFSRSISSPIVLLNLRAYSSVQLYVSESVRDHNAGRCQAQPVSMLISSGRKMPPVMC